MIAPHIAQWALKRNTSDHAHVVVATHVTNINDKPKKAKVDKSERVLETKGGGGYTPPPQPSPMEVAAANDWTAQQEWNRQQAQDKADKDAKDIKDAADLTDWQGRKSTAFNNAQTSGTNRLNSLGITSGDPYGVYKSWQDKLNANNSSLANMQDFSSSFSDSILDEVLGTGRTDQRNKLNTQFNSAMPTYYADDTFGSTSDDAILQGILDSQFNDALQDFAIARDRGQVTSTAYDRAVKDAGTTKSTAWGDLNKIGGGVLSSDIGNINKLREGSLDQAANWDYGSTYDVGAETDRIKKKAGELTGSLDADIRAALGDKNYFDVSNMLGKATSRVGNQTTGTGGTAGTSALYDTFANEADRKNKDTLKEEGTF